MSLPLPAVLPLLAWTELAEIDRLEARRVRLRNRIEQMRPKSHRRLELEYRLRLLTAQQLKLSSIVRQIS